MAREVARCMESSVWLLTPSSSMLEENEMPRWALLRNRREGEAAVSDVFDVFSEGGKLEGDEVRGVKETESKKELGQTGQTSLQWSSVRALQRR